MPDWLLSLATQIPLVAAVAYGFLSRRARTAGEVEDWQKLYHQERADRIAANDRLATAIGEIQEVVRGVEELTKEVIRSAPR